MPYDVLEVPMGGTSEGAGEPGKEQHGSMAKTKKGQKIVPVKGYTRKVNGKRQRVRGHRRSTED